MAVALAALLTGGWWYLHNLILIGNPLGTRLQVGPLTLPGPRSPLAASSQRTLLSQLRRLSSGISVNLRSHPTPFA